MDDQPRPPDNEPTEPAAPPAFDKAAARRRYRAMMRGPAMRSMYILLVIVILAAWGFGIAAAVAPDVEGLPGHDLTVPPRRCLVCHSGQVAGAPPMNHIAFPSCGFCHRQGVPSPTPTRSPF